MKNNFILSAFLFSLFLLSFTGCQHEVEEIINPQNEDVIGINSPLTDLVKKTSMNDGSPDNIIDKSSCLTVVLPVSVIANGNSLTISTPDDYVLIERIFDESATDEDTLVIVFPIKVVLPDYTEETLKDYDDLEDMQEDCMENGEDPDIECLDFVYPFTVSVYDMLNQVSKVITINSDKELFALFEAMDEDELASFNFPLTVMLSDSTELVINDNKMLEDIIEEAQDQCDEDDDNDYNDDDIDDSAFVDILLDGTWRISHFADKTDRTMDFKDYDFRFFKDEYATAEKDGKVKEGEWETYGDDGVLTLELDYEKADFPLKKLKGEWIVTEYSTNKFELVSEEPKDGITATVTFTKN